MGDGDEIERAEETGGDEGTGIRKGKRQREKSWMSDVERRRREEKKTRKEIWREGQIR